MCLSTLTITITIRFYVNCNDYESYGSSLTSTLFKNKKEIMIVGFIKERFYQSQCHGNGGTCHEYICIVCSVTDILKNRDSESVCERERER